MKFTSFRMAFLLVPVLGLIAISSARAQVVTYTFDSTDIHADSVAAASVDPNATASAISRTNLASGASNININGYFEVEYRIPARQRKVELTSNTAMTDSPPQPIWAQPR